RRRACGAISPRSRTSSAVRAATSPKAATWCREAMNALIAPPLIRLRQAEHALGDEAEDQLAAHRRDAPDERLAQVALDVVLGGGAEAAEGHHRLLAGIEARLAGEVLGRVRLGAARLARVVERRGLERHQVG